MGTADFALVVLGGSSIRSEVSRVILAHVVLQRLTVGLWRGLPSRLLGGGVEVVWQVLAVGVADLPACGQACGLHDDEKCQKRMERQHEMRRYRCMMARYANLGGSPSSANLICGEAWQRVSA